MEAGILVSLETAVPIEAMSQRLFFPAFGVNVKVETCHLGFASLFVFRDLAVGIPPIDHHRSYIKLVKMVLPVAILDKLVALVICCDAVADINRAYSLCRRA